jgi:Uma2 family endonuclease
MLPSPPQTLATPQPARLKMSYDEFLVWADEDTHAEWVDGEVIIQMPPKNIHQVVLGFLYGLIHLYVDLFQLGELRVAPFEVKLWPDGPAREPDLLFLAAQHRHQLTEDRLEGPADLIIEIISKESVHRDRHTKFNEYSRAGVVEYWIIDPRPGKQGADFFRLDERGQYQLYATEEDERVVSYVLPGFWLRPAWLWQAVTLSPLTCCLEIEGVAAALTRQIQAAQTQQPDE